MAVIDFLRSWITNIALVMIFITLLDILMPNSDMKRYTKVIAGLIIILVIIKPFLMIKSFDTQFRMKVLETTALLDVNIENKGRELEEYQKAQALELYKANIVKQIKNVISESNSINKEGIDIKMHIDSEAKGIEYGTIRSMIITISHADKSVISVSKVESIKISSDKNVINENNGEYNLNDSNLCSQIKNSVHNYIGLSKESITVKIQE